MVDVVTMMHPGQQLDDALGHVNKINCFSSFCLQKFGEGGGYLLFIFRGQRSYATIFYRCDIKEESRGKKEQHRSKKSENEQKLSMVSIYLWMYECLS